MVETQVIYAVVKSGDTAYITGGAICLICLCTCKHWCL